MVLIIESNLHIFKKKEQRATRNAHTTKEIGEKTIRILGNASMGHSTPTKIMKL